mgnify:CR=1 FL=1
MQRFATQRASAGLAEGRWCAERYGAGVWAGRGGFGRIFDPIEGQGALQVRQRLVRLAGRHRQRLVGQVEADHSDRDTRPEHHVQCLGVGIGVELRGRRRVPPRV